MARKTRQLQIRVTPREKAALERLADAAGRTLSSYVLSKALPEPRLEFDALISAIAVDEDAAFALAELNDLLSAWPGGDLSEALAGADVSGLSPFHRNYVAAMVELAAQRLGERPPSWVTEIRPLAVPYFATDLPGLRLHLLRASPVPFKRRNLFIDASLGARV